MTLNTTSVQELLDLAKKSSDEADEGSTIMTRGSKKIQEAFAATLAKANKSVEVVS